MASNIAKTNHEYLEETVALREQLEGGFIVLAERLKKIRDSRLYDPEYSDFPEFLRELRLSKSSASKLIGVYEKFVVVGGIAVERVVKAGWTNISLGLPAVHDKKSANEIFDRLEHCDRTDAQRTWLEIKNGVDMATCPHSETRTLIICCQCGIKMEKHE